jgi:uncharacterized protein (TIGR03790 family)
MSRLQTFALAVGVLVSANSFGAAPDRVLVVVNDSSAISQAIGAYYANIRAIPAVNVFHLPVGTPTAESISRGDFNTKIRDPIANYLTVTQPQLLAQIDYLVLTKDVPLRVVGNNNAAVDSELTLMLSPAMNDNGQPQWNANPYFGKNQTFASYTGATPRFLVARLDGYETNIEPGTGVPADVKALIDRAQTPATSGVFVLDKDPSKTGGYLVGNDWIDQANTALASLGLTTHLDATTQFQKNHAAIIGYASWGSNDAYNPGPPYYGEVPAASGNVYPGNWLNGALVTDYVSTNGRTFLTAGQSYGQSLIADLIRLGASGAAGYVDEPFLNACVRPNLLFPRFVTGYDAIEAYYMAMPYLSWQNIVVADPLMKSGIQVVVPPSLAAVFPDRGPHQGGGVVWLTGANFGSPGDPATVLFGGVPAPNSTVASATLITATVPAHDPGRVDVTVQLGNGSSTKLGGYVYLPAVELDGATGIGQLAQLEIAGAVNESYLLFLGSGVAQLPAPPFGTLLLDPAQYFAALFQAPFATFQDRVTIDLPIPNDAQLVGITARFQALVGALQPGVPTSYFTNRADLTITP